MLWAEDINGDSPCEAKTSIKKFLQDLDLPLFSEKFPHPAFEFISGNLI